MSLARIKIPFEGYRRPVCFHSSQGSDHFSLEAYELDQVDGEALDQSLASAPTEPEASPLPLLKALIRD